MDPSKSAATKSNAATASHQQARSRHDYRIKVEAQGPAFDIQTFMGSALPAAHERGSEKNDAGPWLPMSLLSDATGAAIDLSKQSVLATGSPFSASTTTNLFDLDVTGYGGAIVYLSGTYTGQAIAWEQNVDGTNWVAISGQNVIKGAVPAVLPVNSSLAGSFVAFPMFGGRFRGRVSAISTGTIVANVLLTTRTLTDNTVYATAVGPAAHGATITGNPVRTAGRAVTANPTAVTTGQTADEICTLVGAKIIKPYSIPEGDWSSVAGASGIVNTTTAVTIAAAAGAGLRNYITGLQIATDTLGGATELAIRDGAAGTVIWRGKLQTGPLALMNVNLPSPLKSTANTLLEVVTLTAVTGGVYVNAQGYIAP
jgi:hypothetical protein